MIKRITALAVIALLTFTGCGGSNNPPKTQIEEGIENVEELEESIEKKMNEIGVTDFNIISIEKGLFDLGIDAVCETEDKEFNVHCAEGKHKATPWIISSIRGKNAQKYYYSDSEHDTVYDYKTGEVIQEGTPFEAPANISSGSMIQSSIRSHVEKEYKDTKVESITVNNDSIALIHLTWDTKNTEETTKKMLRMYSDDLAATMSAKYDNLTEIAVFWKSTYLSKDYKWHYACKDGKALMDDSME